VNSMLGTFRNLVVSVALVATGSLASTASSQDLAFSSTDGGTVTLSSQRGRVVVLMFGGIQDPQCRGEFKALESIAERYQRGEVSIYWVSINSPAEVSGADLKNRCGSGSSITVLRDPNQAAFKKFGCKQLPTLVILNRKGEVHGQIRGGFNPNTDFVNDVASIIDNLLSQK
jgi:peroxiredoxin